MPIQPEREDEITLWIKTRRDAHEKLDDQAGFAWSALDALLDEYRLWADTGQTIAEAMDDELNPAPKCGVCGRRRIADGMDVYDYHPAQVITGQPLGWYSGDDGQMCPECMTKMIAKQ